MVLKQKKRTIKDLPLIIKEAEEYANKVIKTDEDRKKWKKYVKDNFK